MGILVTRFKSLAVLRILRNLVVQPHSPHPPEIIPMKILAKDEKDQQGDLEILEIFNTEVNPSGKDHYEVPHIVNYAINLDDHE